MRKNKHRRKPAWSIKKNFAPMGDLDTIGNVGMNILQLKSIIAIVKAAGSSKSVGINAISQKRHVTDVM